MRLFLARIGGIATTLLFALQLSAQNPNNPIQIALLRWYQADTAAMIPVQSTCIGPQGEAFDGANIWVACTGSSPTEIDEFNASDGAPMLKITSLGCSPNYLLYDGANIWAACPAAGKIIEIEASTGTLLYPSSPLIVASPAGMAFDGQYIWVGSSTANSVVQIQAATHTVTNTFLVSGGSFDCDAPTSVAAISSPTPAIFVVCSTTRPHVMEMTPAGAWVASTAFNAIGGTPGCHNIAFDGQNLWLPTSSGPSGALDAVLEINTTTLGVTAVSMPTNSDPLAVAFDGLYIWVVREDGFVSKVLPSSLATVDTAPTGGGTPYFIAFDGGYVWVSINTP